MKIRSVNVKNYKSFLDSSWLDLGENFTFILGKNNSGKTAFLELFRLEKNQNLPHRDLTIEKNSVVPPNSVFELIVQVSAKEIFDAIQEHGQGFYFPSDPRWGSAARDRIKSEIINNGLELKLSYIGRSLEVNYPSHQLFKPDSTKVAAVVSASQNRRSINVSDPSRTDEDGLPAIFQQYLRRKVFAFTAERMKNSDVPFSSEASIRPDAANLPRALFEMQQNPALWEEFNRIVNEILPNVRRVITVGSDRENTNLQIRLWPVDPDLNREDLIVKLSDSGTGVGQVLSIVCAAMTMDEAVIAIDEPNNFLHPGAVKALMRILKQYPHQYIVASHSVDSLSEANPSKVYLVEWEGCVSKARPVLLGNIDDNKATLSELGISLSDIFGVDRIIWVEGQTEELCVPIVLQDIVGHMPSDTAVLRVRSVDEIIKKQGRDKIIVDIYQRMSSLGGLAPRDMRCIFDREARTEEYINEVYRDSAGVVSFLPVRTFENFLLENSILSEELSGEMERIGSKAVDITSVAGWIEENRRNYSAPKDDGPNWKRTVDAPNLLKGLFWDLGKIEYRKTQHSPLLTRRLLKSDSPLALELKETFHIFIQRQ